MDRVSSCMFYMTRADLNRKIRDRWTTTFGPCVHAHEMAQTQFFSPILFFNLQLIKAFVR
jgi:hypothetical protein